MVLLIRSRNAGLRISSIFLPLKDFPQMASGIWGARNHFLIFCMEFSQIVATGRVASLISSNVSHILLVSK